MAKVDRKEMVNEWKCVILMKAILKMIEDAELPGYDIIASLMTVMCNVMYATCDNKSQEIFEATAENIKQGILNGVREIEKQDKEGKLYEHKQANQN